MLSGLFAAKLALEHPAGQRRGARHGRGPGARSTPRTRRCRRTSAPAGSGPRSTSAAAAPPQSAQRRSCPGRTYLDRGPLDVGSVLADQGIAVARPADGAADRRRDHVRGRRLGVGLDEQPAAVRVAPVADLVGQGDRARARRARGHGAGPRRVLGARPRGRRSSATSSVSSALQAEVGWHLLRTLALGAVAAVLAYALTMLFRHTAGHDRAAVRRQRRGGDPAQPAAVLRLGTHLAQPQRVRLAARGAPSTTTPRSPARASVAATRCGR